MIKDFVIEKMCSYILGGMSAQSAAHFTRGELLAMYKGDHYSRDASGKLKQTTPPEALALEAATQKCNYAINEILKVCAEMAEKGATVNAETKRTPAQSKAPENTPRALSGATMRTGLEGLKSYVKKGTA